MVTSPVRSGSASGLSEPLPAWPWVRAADEGSTTTPTSGSVAIALLPPGRPAALATLTARPSGLSAAAGPRAWSSSDGSGSDSERRRQDALHMVADALASGSARIDAASPAREAADRIALQRQLLLAYLPYPLTGLLLDLRG